MSNRQLHADDIYKDETYPVLPGIAYAVRWLDGFTSLLEQLIMSLSGIFLTVGISFSMLDFLTGGALLQNEYVFYSWAWIQTIAIDSQFVSMWYRSKLAFKRGQVLQGLGYIFLGGILAFVTFGAAAIPSLQSALHIKFNDALSLLYLNPVLLVYARSVVVIVLAVIGAYTRSVLHFDKSGARHEIVEDGDENVDKNIVTVEPKIVAVEDEKSVEEQEQKDEKKSKKFSFPRIKIFGKKTDKILPPDDEKNVEEQDEKSGENFDTVMTKNAGGTSENFAPADDKNYPLQTDKNLLQMAQNYSAPAQENFVIPTTPRDEIFSDKKQDTGDELKSADVIAAINSARVPVELEEQTDEIDTNPLAMSVDAAFQLSSNGDSAVSRYNDEQDAENATPDEDSSRFELDGASRVPVAKREQIRLSKQDVLSHPKVVEIFPDLRTRRRAVDGAWNVALKVKSDGFARENGVIAWTKSLSTEKQTAKHAAASR